MFKDADLIYSYTRAEAIEDGVLIDVSQMAKEAGIRYPVAVTDTVWQLLTPTKEDEGMGQSREGRLWDALSLIAFYAKRAKGSVIKFPLLICSGGTTKQHILKAVCGPGDNLEPVITVMMPDED